MLWSLKSSASCRVLSWALAHCLRTACCPGKGHAVRRAVLQHPRAAQALRGLGMLLAGVWRGVEGGGQEDEGDGRAEEDLRRLPERHGCPGAAPAHTRPAAREALENHGGLSTSPFALQRTFREIMFLQELTTHENIIRSAAARTLYSWILLHCSMGHPNLPPWPPVMASSGLLE